MNNNYLSFWINSECFAVDTKKVLEVLQNKMLSRVPNAPKYVKGILNFRGDIVSIIDTRKVLNLPNTERIDSITIVILDLSTENETFHIGAIVDRVDDVIVIQDEDILPVPIMSKEFNSNFLSGVYRLDEQFILIMEANRLFENIVNEELSENITI